MQGSDGDFYGTTDKGGSKGDGVIFKITANGTFTVPHSCCSQKACTDGLNPFAGLIQGTDGNIYGTTQGGGAHDDGEIFEITPDNTFTILYSFCSQSGCLDGEFPQTGIIQGVDGNFYGTALLGGKWQRDDLQDHSDRRHLHQALRRLLSERMP